MVDIPSASSLEGIRGGCAEVRPTGTRATTDRRATGGGAFSANYGGHCRRVKHCTAGANSGKDL